MKTHGLEKDSAVFVDYLLISTIFISGFYWSVSGFVFYLSYAVFVVCFFLMLKSGSIYIFRYYWLSFFFLFFYSLIVMFFNDNSSGMVKMMVSLFIFYLMLACYFSLVYRYRDNIETLFLMYVKAAVFVAAFSLFQEMVLMFGVDYSYLTVNGIFKDMVWFWGVPGFSAEPAELSIVLIPAYFYSLVSFSKSRFFLFSNFLISVAIILSSSSLGIVGIFLSLIFSSVYVVRKSLILFFLAIPLVFGLLSFLVYQDYFLVRLIDSSELFLSGNAYIRPEGFNLSSYSQLINYDMVLNSLVDFNFFGSGFSGYYLIYDNYIDDYYIPLHRDDIPGRGTATSMLLRIVGEFGLLGLVAVILYFSYSGRKSFGDRIYVACFIFLMLALLRMGIYYANGAIFFAILYFYIARIHGSEIKRV